MESSLPEYVTCLTGMGSRDIFSPVRPPSEPGTGYIVSYKSGCMVREMKCISSTQISEYGEPSSTSGPRKRTSDGVEI